MIDNAIERRAAQIIELIFNKEYDRANAMIETARRSLSDCELHRLTALSAVLQKEAGNVRSGIDLMRQAVKEDPTWLPHLYRLSVFLMDAGQWVDADLALDELISLSEKNDDTYFLNEARMRKIVCLMALDRRDEIQSQKAKIAADVVVFIGDRAYRAADLE